MNDELPKMEVEELNQVAPWGAEPKDMTFSGEWVSVDDGKPEIIKGGMGILLGRDSGVVCSMQGVYWDDDFYALSQRGMQRARDITHWAYLPAMLCEQAE